MNVDKLFRLSVPAGNKSAGKVLSVTMDGALSYGKEPQGDDVWKAVPVDGGPKNKDPGFHLVSGRFNQCLEYNPAHGEEVYAVPFLQLNIPKADLETEPHTVWHMSEDHEIYTLLPSGDRKYLWTAARKLYATPDEYLAERWTAVGLEGYDIGLGPHPTPVESKRWDWIVIAIVLGLVVAMLLLRSRVR